MVGEIGNRYDASMLEHLQTLHQLLLHAHWKRLQEAEKNKWLYVTQRTGADGAAGKDDAEGTEESDIGPWRTCLKSSSNQKVLPREARCARTESAWGSRMECSCPQPA